jgi:hypothetical protein
MSKTLTLESIGEVDGGAAGILIADQINKAVGDFDANGEDMEKRKVVIQVTMQVDKKSGEKRTSVQCQAKLPPRRTREVASSTKKERGVARLLFDDLDDDATADHQAE